MIEIVEVNGTALVEDLGRPGYSHLGVSPSGAADRGALIAANRAVGNPDDMAGLEIMGEFRLRALADVLLAVAGAAVTVRVDGEAVPGAVVAVAVGAEVGVSAPRWGLRAYLAVRGGLDVAPVLGSRSTDVLSGLGPNPVQVGDRLGVGSTLGSVPTTERSEPGFPTTVMLDAGPGPRASWLADPDALYGRPWRVSHLADRVGLRLEGEALVRAVTAELASEGVVTGSVQVPPNGQPVILGPDHPVTGGYPVVAVLTTSACDAVAQLRAGAVVRFRRRGGG